MYRTYSSFCCRYWEALRKWDEALLLNPNHEKIHEMKAQVNIFYSIIADPMLVDTYLAVYSQAYMAVGEVFSAVTSSQQAVNLKPNWWEALQTLGRAHLQLGEVGLVSHNCLQYCVDAK